MDVPLEKQKGSLKKKKNESLQEEEEPAQKNRAKAGQKKIFIQEWRVQGPHGERIGKRKIKEMRKFTKKGALKQGGITKRRKQELEAGEGCTSWEKRPEANRVTKGVPKSRKGNKEKSSHTRLKKGIGE